VTTFIDMCYSTAAKIPKSAKPFIRRHVLEGESPAPELSRKDMSQDDAESIIKQIKEHGPIRLVNLQFLNEPTISREMVRMYTTVLLEKKRIRRVGRAEYVCAD